MISLNRLSAIWYILAPSNQLDTIKYVKCNEELIQDVISRPRQNCRPHDQDQDLCCQDHDQDQDRL